MCIAAFEVAHLIMPLHRTAVHVALAQVFGCDAYACCLAATSVINRTAGSSRALQTLNTTEADALLHRGYSAVKRCTLLHDHLWL
jgi:hypothetical protein